MAANACYGASNVACPCVLTDLDYSSSCVFWLFLTSKTAFSALENGIFNQGKPLVYFIVAADIDDAMIDDAMIEIIKKTEKMERYHVLLIKML